MSTEKPITPQSPSLTASDVFAKLMKIFGPFCELGISIDDFALVFYRANKLSYNRGTFYEILGKKLFKTKVPKYSRFVCDVTAYSSKWGFIGLNFEINPHCLLFYTHLMRMMDPMCKLGFCLDDFLQVYYKMANEMYVRSKFYEVLGPELFETRKPVYESIVYKFSAWTSKHSKAPALAITKIDSNFLQRALKRGIKICICIFLKLF